MLKIAHLVLDSILKMQNFDKAYPIIKKCKKSEVLTYIKPRTRDEMNERKYKMKKKYLWAILSLELILFKKKELTATDVQTHQIILKNQKEEVLIAKGIARTHSTSNRILP